MTKNKTQENIQVIKEQIMFPKKRQFRISKTPAFIESEERYPDWVDYRKNNFVIIEESFWVAGKRVIINVFATKHVSVKEDILGNNIVATNYKYHYLIERYDDMSQRFVGHHNIQRDDQIEILEMIAKDAYTETFFQTNDSIRDICIKKRQKTMDRFYETFDSHKKFVDESIDIVLHGYGLFDPNTKPKTLNFLRNEQEIRENQEWSSSFGMLKKEKSKEKKKSIGKLGCKCFSNDGYKTN